MSQQVLKRHSADPLYQAEATQRICADLLINRCEARDQVDHLVARVSALQGEPRHVSAKVEADKRHALRAQDRRWADRDKLSRRHDRDERGHVRLAVERAIHHCHTKIITLEGSRPLLWLSEKELLPQIQLLVQRPVLWAQAPQVGCRFLGQAPALPCLHEFEPLHAYLERNVWVCRGGGVLGWATCGCRCCGQRNCVVCLLWSVRLGQGLHD
mmetsp:Transcript_11546/g.33297  ORF Transcript_11546/g.33297 Transcript_11546/m.33297 type:complete len:213 (+) Transcript_11546:331-969(+)